MNKRGLSLDASKRRRVSLIIAVVISVMTLAGPASAAPDRADDVSNASWTHVSTSYSTTFGRSWS